MNNTPKTAIHQAPSAVTATLCQPGWMATTGYWAVPTGLALVLATFVYGILPLLGLANITQWFSVNKLLLIPAGIVGALTYSRYCNYLAKQPWWLVFFMLLAWPIIDCVNEQLLISGINIKLRPLLGLVMGIPGLWCMWVNRQALFRLAPQMKYFAIFFTWLSLYFVFNTTETNDPKMLIEGAQNSGSIALMQYVAYYYLLVGMGVAAVAVGSCQSPEMAHRYFDKLNTALLSVSILTALYTIAGYPFMLTSQMVDGFQRAFGIYSHPNALSHHMGLFMLYLLGLFIYYQGKNHRRINPLLLHSALVICLIAFLLGLSKSAIGMALVGSVILVGCNLSSPVVRKHLPGAIISLTILIPVGIWLYAAITDQSLFDVLEARLNATESMDWRVEIWGYLTAQIDMASIWLGHGFTNANQWVFQLTYDTDKNAKPLIMVHNGYIALLYDLGIMGYTYFFAVLSMLFAAIRLFRNKSLSQARPLLSCTLAMGVYFLAICAGDEMTYMFDAPLYFWMLGTTLVALALQSQHSTVGVATNDK